MSERMRPCPMCSFYRVDHPEMLHDSVSVPILMRGKTGKWALVGNCSHIRALYGPYDAEDDAEFTWDSEVDRLQVEKEQKRKELDERFAKRASLTSHASAG